MLRWVVAAVAGTALAAALWAFEPWRLFTSSTVDEPLPTASRAVDDASVDDASTSRPDGVPSGSSTPAVDDVEVVASGRFEDAEHDTSGTARLLRLVDGRRFVRLEDLASSDGPDLHVWLSDQPSGGPWGSYDDGDHLALGELKATHGNQNYEIPADADLRGLDTVVIWCDRFNVAFGTAALAS